ncbi:hypothetical protein BGZ80_004590 [Entomortierella chlamydospora]|uniref:Uncharacterized protein n=1 Tax=Entomortierella chlamydospora TaxID=101097 RepID=A0A9P6MM55_9FUNG|nr:hypothetical protein BGZ80_004590 [Entomortierella chlamydospora]
MARSRSIESIQAAVSEDSHLHNDFETLRSLLYVDKFFFRAAIPYLIKDHISRSVKDWLHNRSRSEKLFALILASFLEARLKKLRDPHDASELAEIVLEKILERFGLRLVKPFTLPGHQMLRSFLRRIDDMPKNHDYDCNNRKYGGEYGQEFDGNAPEEMDSGMIIDYSKFIPKIPGPFDGSTMQATKEHGGWVSPELYIQSDYGRLEKHSVDHQVEDDYLNELHKAFSKLWQHYNHECTDSFTLDIANAQRFLPFSKEMPKLHTLCLDRYSKMTASHLKNTVLFIKQNQETFPNKPPLYIQFGLDQWDLPEESYSSLGNNSLKTALAEIKCRRDELFQYMKPLITIHEAVGEPPFFNISNIPYFYEHADGIKLNRLWGLSDFDENRIDQGEGPAIEPSLRRCSALKVLWIGAGSPDILSWAANEVMGTDGFLALESGNESMSNTNVLEKIEPIKISNDSKQHSQQNPQTRVAQLQVKILGCIESLSIRSSRPYRFGLQIINDASIAFSTSLRVIGITAGDDHYFSSSDVPAVVRRQHFKKSFQLHDVSSANGVGSWPFFMPRLQKIHINLSRVASIQVGTFDQSPNIEDIDIEFGSVTAYDCRPSDDRPLPPPESDEYLDYRWLQPKIDKSLFPIWNLQKLKKLKLYNLAASRFDFASLSNTPCLEKLDLGAYYIRADPLIGVNEYKNIQIRVWKERLTLGTDNDTTRYKPAAAARPWMWPLPVLSVRHWKRLN